jgi:ubiquinone/menaquinone biosynthesis C-methylase UbiE
LAQSIADMDTVSIQEFPETADIETSSEEYAHRFAGSVGKWFLKVQEDATLRMLKPLSGLTVLDVGGGHGQITGGLVREGYQVTVLGSAQSCSLRIQSFVERGECDFRVGNILDLPFSDRSFDVVISYRLLPHVVLWQMLLKEFSRVAKQAVILDYPEVRSVNYIAPYLFKFKKQLEGNTRPYQCFKELQIQEEMRQHHFYVADRYHEFFLPMVLHRKLGQPKLSAAVEDILRRLGLTGVFGSPVILKLMRKTRQSA